MKNLTLLLFSLIIILSACQNSTKETNTNNTSSPPSTETSEHSESKPATTSEPQGLYIKGGGNEPGWHIKITKETNRDFSFDLIMNYGQDKHSGVLTSSQNEEDGTESFVGKDEAGNKISVIFKKESCRDDGDIDHNRSITLKMQNNTYTGCGDKEK